jgi:hypothetical protein
VISGFRWVGTWPRVGALPTKLGTLSDALPMGSDMSKCTCEQAGNGVISGGDGRLLDPDCPRHGYFAAEDEARREAHAYERWYTEVWIPHMQDKMLTAIQKVLDECNIDGTVVIE